MWQPLEKIEIIAKQCCYYKIGIKINSSIYFIFWLYLLLYINSFVHFNNVFKEQSLIVHIVGK
jgi:hypothetical protein